MARVNICGFETGVLADETNGPTTAASLVTSPTNGGTYALQLNPAAGTSQYSVSGYAATGLNANFSVATCYYRFFFRYNSGSGNDIADAIDTTSAIKFFVKLNANFKLEAYDSLSSLLATGTTVLTADTWYRIEFKVGTGASAAWEVKINGTVEMSGTGNLKTNNNAFLRLGDASSSGTYTWYYDDVAIDDAGYPGDGKIVAMTANADGVDNSANWSASAGTKTSCVQTNDVDTSYITDAVSSTTDAYCSSLITHDTAGITGTVNAVKSFGLARKVASTACSIIYYTRSGSASSNKKSLTTVDPGQTYVSFADVLSTDPSTSAAWTLAGLDNVQPGVQHNQNNARELRCTYLAAMVEFVPAVVIPDPLSFYRAGNFSGFEEPVPF